MNQKDGFLYVTEAEYFDPANEWLHTTKDYAQIKVVDETGEVGCSISTHAPRSRLFSEEPESDEGLVTLTPEETKVFAEKILLHPPKVPDWLYRAVMGDDKL